MTMTVESLNGFSRKSIVNGKRRTSPAKKSILPSQARFRFGLTIGMGTFIPLFSLGLSHVGGNLLRQGIGENNFVLISLAGFAFGLMACILSVSLSHLAWAVQDITRSHKWASWALAVAFDLAIVLGELCHVQGKTGLDDVVTVLMVCVCGLSMFLNCWAFILCPKREARKQKAR